MRITIVVPGTLPAIHYGGTQRVMWDLGRGLSRLGHHVCFLAERIGGSCPFAEIHQLNPKLCIADQLPYGTDIIHFNNNVVCLNGSDIPYVVTIHGNGFNGKLDSNTIFVSRNHAQRHGCESYVYNGLDWEEIGPMNLSLQRNGYHFLGKAAWSVKNVDGAINLIRHLPHERLTVLGGHRLNLKMGFRLTCSTRIHFYGMVKDAIKYEVMQHSLGLIFPVTWHEPFGLAIIESLYAGCPVFGTPYGSLPELINDSRLGFLTTSESEMLAHMREKPTYDARICHEYARDCFGADKMAQAYLRKYEQVLNGHVLNKSFSKCEQLYRGLPWNK